MLRRLLPLFGLFLSLLCAPGAGADSRPQTRPAALIDVIPTTQWDHRRESTVWTRAALKALKSHGTPLAQSVPADIGAWCPGYPAADPSQRRAFWVGFLSTLAKYESRWRPRAVGGNGRWYGLLQILPATARGYGCRARSGTALKTGAENLSCAIRIMTRTVTRDGVIHARKPRWSGVAADWGPMRSARKRAAMAAWLQSQDYCQRTSSPRPPPRPADLVRNPWISGPALPALRPNHPAWRQARRDAAGAGRL